LNSALGADGAVLDRHQRHAAGTTAAAAAATAPQLTALHRVG
jgi:hypothetical protein